MSEPHRILTYRPEIDGLRALAVIPVILFHAGVPGFEGGFVGVDIFFVISGFLITQILLRDMDTGQFSLSGFYLRRASRLLPALYLVLLACLVYMLVWQPPHAARDLAQSLVATTVYLQNMLLVAESATYFSLDNDLKPLLHTWSLAVEEQYYLVYPALLFVLAQLKASGRLWSLFALCTLGLVGTSLLVSIAPVISFYSLPTRAWQLLLGAVAAILVMKDNRAGSSGANNALSVLGLALIIGSVIILSEDVGVPGWPALLPTSGTALILLFATEGTLVNRLLKLTPLVWIGLGSYSAYLWHQPLLAIARTEIHAPINVSVLSGLLICLVILSAASYRLVEQPFRKRTISVRTQIGIFLALTLLFVGAGVAGHKTRGFESLKSSQLAPERAGFVVSYPEEVKRRGQKLRAEQAASGDETYDILILGDSMAEDLFISLRQVGVRATLIPVHKKCFLAIAEDQTCDGDLYAYADLFEPDLPVILAGNFALNGDISGVEALYTRMKSDGLDVKVLSTLKLRNGSNLSYQYARSDWSAEEFGQRVYRSLDPGNAVNDALKAAIPEADIIDKFGLFCDARNETCSIYSEAGDAYFYDKIHLTLEGTSYLGDQLKDMQKTY